MGSLVALSGVMGRPIITLTGRAGEVPRVEERTPPEGWEMSALTGAPLLLTHEMDHHYTPVRVQEGSFWGWIPAWESAVREGSGHTEGLKQRSADAWERKDRNGCGRRVDRTRRGRDERRAWSVCSDVSADLSVPGCNDSLSLRPAALVNGESAMELDQAGHVTSWLAAWTMQDRSILLPLGPVAEEQTMELDDPEQPEWKGGG